MRGDRPWQCRLTDPHPDVGHDLPPDAEFGRVLHEQTPEWLAAVLRDQVARRRNMQARLDAQQAIMLQLAEAWAGTTVHGAWELPPAAADWLRANAPTAAETLGLSE